MELGAAWLGSGSRKTCFGEWGGGLSPCFSPQSPDMSLRNSLPSVSLCFEPRLRPLSLLHVSAASSLVFLLQSCSAVIRSPPASRIFQKHKSNHVTSLLCALSVEMPCQTCSHLFFSTNILCIKHAQSLMSQMHGALLCLCALHLLFQLLGNPSRRVTFIHELLRDAYSVPSTV